MSKKQKKVPVVSQQTVDHLFDRADGLVSEGLHLVEQQLHARLKDARRSVDRFYGRRAGGAMAAATKYVRSHPVQAAGLCVGAGVVALAVANRQAAA